MNIRRQPAGAASPAEAAFNRGVAHHQGGRFADAEGEYRAALTGAPDNPAVLHMLGLALAQSGRLDEGAALVERAVSLAPGQAVLHQNLGNIRLEQGRPADAIGCFEQAAAIAPENGETRLNLGRALMACGRPVDAGSAYAAARAIDPDDRQAAIGQGTALLEQGHAEAAAAILEDVARMNPESADVYFALGNARLDLGRAGDAAASLCRAVDIDPRQPDAHYNLGLALKQDGRPTEAADALRAAIALRPGWANAHNNLGNALMEAGEFVEAIGEFHAALAVRPDFVQAASNILYAQCHDEHLSPAELADEFRAFGARFADPLLPAELRHDNAAERDRRLRVGYVSPDFRGHTVAYYVEPLLAHHDREAVEIFCYAEATSEDDATGRFRALADHWRPTAGLDDEALARQVRQDGIDILVDLAGHTAGNRLLAFARKPAPVQIAHLIGLMQTTGLAAIDYILGDPWVTPAGCEDRFAERVWRLDRPFTSFRPDPAWPEVTALPAAVGGAGGHITFASFNKPARIGPATARLWAGVLAAVPGSRLLLKHPDYREDMIADRVRGLFSDPGLDGRVEIRPVADGWAREMGVYAEIDIALDTWPMCGGSTSVIALWMGIPLVTLATGAAHTRFGLAAGAGAGGGFPDGAAESEEDFVARAADLAGDLGRLAELRAGLRERLLASPLMDHAGLARATEDAYRAMWRKWCEAQTNNTDGEGG